MPKHNRYDIPVGAGLISLSSLAYASYGVWIKLIGDYFALYSQIILRCSLALLILLPLILWRHKFSAIRWRHRWWWAALLICSLASQAPFYYAIYHIGVSLGTAIMYAGLVIGAFLFGWLFDGERFTASKMVSTAFGMLGIFLIFNPAGSSVTVLGLTGAVIAGLAAGATIVCFRRTPYGTLQTTALNWIAIILANIPLALYFRESIPAFNMDIEWLYLLGFSLAAIAAGWFLIVGLKFVDAGTAGILGLLEIIFAVGFGLVLFREQLSVLDLYGIAAILLAAAVPYLRPPPAKSRPK